MKKGVVEERGSPSPFASEVVTFSLSSWTLVNSVNSASMFFSNRATYSAPENEPDELDDLVLTDWEVLQIESSTYRPVSLYSGTQRVMNFSRQ